MDVAAASISMKQGQLQQQVGISVMKMAMDTSEQQNSAMLDMAAQRAAQPHIGGNVDISR